MSTKTTTHDHARPAVTSGIFISYRREDSAAYAGRICDQLTAIFGEDRVFMDVEDIRPGQNFAQAIEQTIANSSVVLVIIGPRWLEILRNRSNEQQHDYVCREIEEALRRKVTVVPVLVGGAKINQLADLPENLAELPLHEAAELRDGTFKEDCARLAEVLKSHPGLHTQSLKNKTARKALVVWTGGFAALAAVLFAISSFLGIGPLREYRVQKSRIHQLLDTARAQRNLTEYESAFKTYQEVLKMAPENRSALDGQVDAAMLWLQNFHVIVGEGQKVEELAGQPLSEMISVLEAELARTDSHSERAADILAHLGWAHWLNQHIAQKEFGPAAEQYLRRALTVDPANVYANSMLGNWLLQTGGSFDDALHCFDIALKSNKQRPLVREMQLGGMIYNDTPGVRAELIRVANQMRINAEPMSEQYKQRILSSYSPTTNSPDELTETLSAVPPKDAWATFLWLDDKPRTSSEREEQRIHREFIQANIAEIAGNSDEALAMFRTLEGELKRKNYSWRMADDVAIAIKRLSRSRSVEQSASAQSPSKNSTRK